MHFECGFRQAGGSVAHILRRCECYKLGSTLNDPPALTKRQAACAALQLFRQIEAWFGEKAAADKPPFAIMPGGGMAIHPQYGLMMLAHREELNGAPWGPWIELFGGGFYEIEEQYDEKA